MPKELVIAQPNDKIKQVINWLLFIYVAIETVYKTIFGLYFEVTMERIQCIIGAGLALLAVYTFVKSDKGTRKKWIVGNAFVFAYFLVRVVTLIYTGVQYTVIRGLFFEGIYLIVLSSLIVDTKFCKRTIFPFFIAFNFVLNCINIVFYYACKNAVVGSSGPNILYQFALKYTFLGNESTYYYSCLYANPNFFGMMTGLALIISLNYFYKGMDRRKKIVYAVYVIFSLYCILVSNCSSAIVGLAACAFVVYLVKKFKCFTRKTVIIWCAILAVLASSSVLVYISMQNELGAYTEEEGKMSRLTTGRYAIWKDCYYGHNDVDKLLLGCGNITLEKQERYEYMLTKGPDYGYDKDGSLSELVGTHNGYIGMLYCTGIFSALLFMCILFKRIRTSNILNKKYWYLAIIFVVVINLVESMIILSKNFPCLYMFLILAMDDEKTDTDDMLLVGG